jgi:hypothetical protein
VIWVINIWQINFQIVYSLREGEFIKQQDQENKKWKELTFLRIWIKYFEIMKRKYKGIKYLSQLKDRAHRLYDSEYKDMPVNGLLK